jgi:hypothetical protein
MFKGDVDMPEQDREHALTDSPVPDDQYLVPEIHHTPPQTRLVCTGMLGVKSNK